MSPTWRPEDAGAFMSPRDAIVTLLASAIWVVGRFSCDRASGGAAIRPGSTLLSRWASLQKDGGSQRALASVARWHFRTGGVLI